jgi:hypothetical protein
VLATSFSEEALVATNRTSETAIRREVERMFGEISAKRGKLCTNPVTGGDFVYGSDPIKKQKEAAYKRLAAREHFALHGPPDAPRIPTDDYARNRAKHASGLLGFMTAQYIWSLENQHDLTVHPSFADFASGLLWQHENIGGCTELPFTPQQLSEMKRRYPPRKLEGLEYFCWSRPRRHARPKETRRAA